MEEQESGSHELETMDPHGFESGVVQNASDQGS